MENELQGRHHTWLRIVAYLSCILYILLGRNNAIILGCVLLRISRIFGIFNTAHLFISKTNLFIWEFFDRYKQCVIRRIFLTLVAEGRVLLTVAKDKHMSEFYKFHFQLEPLLLSMRNSTAERHFAIENEISSM